MRLDEQIALAWQALMHALRRTFDPALWAPWLLLGALQILLLGALCWMAHPWLSPVMAPLVARLAGAEALHYPALFAALPALYARLDLLLIALPGAFTLGASAALFAASFRGGTPRPGQALRLALTRWPALMAVNLPYHLLAFGAGLGIAVLVGPRGGIAGAAGYLFALGASVLFQSLFLYVNALVAVGGCGVREAFAALPRTWSNGMASALVLGVLLLLPLLPLNLLMGAGGTIAGRGTPELVAFMLLVQIAVALYAGFLLSGASTLVYLTAMSPADGRRSE